MTISCLNFKSGTLVEIEDPKKANAQAYIRGQELDSGKEFVDVEFEREELKVRISMSKSQFLKFVKKLNKQAERFPKR